MRKKNLARRVKAARALLLRAQGAEDLAANLHDCVEEVVNRIQDQIGKGQSTGNPREDARLSYERDLLPPPSLDPW